ncbi:MAG: oligosaccharide flippase family protein [Deltaproteobacteria bacterium]|nr:oligosaccharide flippase family protein [Deltaproteobacteria bacterium]
MPRISIEVTEKIIHIKNGFYTHLRNLILSQKDRIRTLSVLVLVNFVIMGFGFLTRVKIANMLGKEGFGMLAYGLALGTFGGVAVRFGMDRTLVRDLIHHRDRFGELVAGSVLLRGAIFFFVLFGILFWKALPNYNNNLSWAIITIFIARCLLSLDLQSVYDTWQKMERHAMYNLVQRCLYFAIIWTVVIISPEKFSINLIAAALLVTAFLYLIMQHQWAWRQIIFNKTTKSVMKTALSMGSQNFIIFLAALGGLFIGSLNQLVLKHFCGAAELGGYAAAWTITSLAMALLSQVSRIGLPAIARVTRQDTGRAERIYFLFTYSAVMFMMAASIGIPVFFFPELILRTIFSPEYISVAGIMRIMSIYIIIYSIAIVSSQYVVAARMERLYFFNVILGGCLSVILCYILIPKFFGLGAVFSLLIAHGLTIALNLIGMIKHLKAC